MRRASSLGERVALTMGNGIDWCLAFFGTMMAGAVAVPVNTRLAPVERTYVLRDSGASLALRSGQPLPDGRPYVDDSLHRRKHRLHHLYERNHRCARRAPC